MDGIKARAFSFLIVLLFIFAFLSGSVRAGTKEPNDERYQLKFSGRVVDSAGQPVSEAAVQLFEVNVGPAMVTAQTKLAGKMITKNDGVFSFEVSMGKEQPSIYFVTAYKDGLALGWTSSLVTGQKDAEIELTEPKELSGIIVDEKGNPIADSYVSIFMMTRKDKQGEQTIRNFGKNPEYFTFKTDSLGKFIFNNIPADAKADLLVKKDGRATVCTNSRYSVAGQFSPAMKDIKIVQPVEAKIEGKLIEKETGKPVGGIRLVLLSNMPFINIPPVTSKEDGTFSFVQLPATQFRLIIEPPPFWEQADWFAEEIKLTTEAGKTISGVKMEVSRGGVLEVLVTDANSGRPVENARIYMRNEKSQVTPQQTNKSGIALIKLLPGQYNSISVSAPNHTLEKQEQKITIESGKTTKVNFKFKEQPKITGIVTGKD